MRKHRLGKQLLIVLCVVLIVFLAGCRPSPVLEQIIYEQNHQVDPDTETKTMNDDLKNEEPDEDIPSRETVDDSKQTKDQEYTAAFAGDTDTDSEEPDAVYDAVYSPYGEFSEPDETNPTEGSTSETATGSTEAGGDEGGSVSSGAGDASGTEGASGEQAQGGTTAGEESTGGGSGDGDSDMVSGDGKKSSENSPEPPINEPDTEPEDLPTGTRVTAVGEAAAIVEMLGGQLVGTSSSFMENQLAQQVFASQGVSEAQAWWDGDGSSVISDGNFQALLDANPEVCIWISGEDTFSTEQIAALDAAGIAYVVLPNLNSIANIEEAVMDVGQVLGDDAQSIASNYCSWADNVIGSVAGKGSTKYTVYIAKWDPDVHWRIYNDTGPLQEGDGAAVSMKYSKVSPLDECMGYANLNNLAVDNVYVEPLRPLYWVPEMYGGSGKYDSKVSTIYNSSVGVGLGNVAYPAVIVADSEIKANIINDVWHWTPGHLVQINSTKAFGYEDGRGYFVSTRIEDGFNVNSDVFVNPTGVGSWTGGSVESPMEAAWLACKFQGAISMDELRSMVSEFYSTFYGAGVDTADVLGE